SGGAGNDSAGAASALVFRHNQSGPAAARWWRAAHTTPEAQKVWHAGEGDKLLHFLPWQKLPQYVLEDEGKAVRAWLAQPSHDPWKLDKHCRELAAPNLDIVGWHDHCNGDMLLHPLLVKE